MLAFLLLIQAATAAAPAPVAAPTQTAFSANADSKIQCRTVRMTGSRLADQKVCLPKREWDRMHTDAKESVSDMQDKRSTRPGDLGQ